MGRVAVALPERFGFSTKIPVRISDINYGGHLGNDAAVSILHEARMRFLNAHGFTELDAGGPGLIMADMTVVYRSEAFYGDTLTAEVAVGAFSRVGCDFFYRLSDSASGREVVRARSGMVFFDYARRRAVGVPDRFRAIHTGDAA